MSDNAELRRMYAKWYELGIAAGFPDVHHFRDKRFRSSPSDLDEFFNWCSGRRVGKQNRQTIARALRVAELVENGHGFNSALTTAWQQCPVCVRGRSTNGKTDNERSNRSSGLDIGMPVYTPHPERDARINSAKTAIRALVALDLYPAHKRELLSVCIWKVTEADGKKRVRFWSEGAIGASDNELRHEHVNERKHLIDRLLSGESVDNVVIDAVACMVTKAEHDSLGQAQSKGWNRYREVGLSVYDSLQGAWLDADALGRHA